MEATISYRLAANRSPKTALPITRTMVDAATRSIKPYAGGYSGRGITVCAGSYLYFTNAWVLIRMLRKLGCNLPVQFWYYGEKEMDRKMRRLVEPYGVECVDARRIAERNGRRIHAGWPLKPFSILHSPFEEVLALDADNFPIRDPEYLFESLGYLETGAMFWPDIGRMAAEKRIWKIMGVPFRDEPEFESGQVLVNKSLSWEPLNLALWMNEEGRAEYFYKLIWGDKDTFRFAWHKFGFPFAMTRIPVQMLSVIGGPCGSGVMCQHDLDGERIFQHRNLLKWQLFGENPWVPGYLFEGECREYLAELRRLWNGRIGPSATQLGGRAAEWKRQLLKRVWLLETNGIASTPVPTLDQNIVSSAIRDEWPTARTRALRELRFFPQGHCGRTSDSRITFWDILECGTELRLRFAGRDGTVKPTAELRLQLDGSWAGRVLGSKNQITLKLDTLESFVPSTKGNMLRNAPRQHRVPRKIHVFNSARGIGDHITALYACVGATNAGWEVIFHTRFPDWLGRVRHQNLTITGKLPPRHAHDLNYDSILQTRYGHDRARWYADVIQGGLTPGRPEYVDQEMRIPRFDFNRYVVLAPFSAWPCRDWPGANWSRLTHLLRQSGREVVAIGVRDDVERFGTVFQHTTALWGLSHPAEWVIDVMLGAECVIGNDSGMVHVSGLLGVPTFSVHAHLTPEFLFSQANVTSIVPKTNCAFCRWQLDRGYNSACDAACSALATIGPEEVAQIVERAIYSAQCEPNTSAAAASSFRKRNGSHAL